MKTRFLTEAAANAGRTLPPRFRTERVRELRRGVLRLKAAGARDDLAEAELGLMEYVLRGVAAGDQGFSDPRYAAALALGQHDHDGGLE